MTRIYLIRHAEAEGNLFRVVHGQYNSTLTPQGYRQLRYLRQRFEDIPIDAVYGSDLLRAHATASAVYVPKGLPFRPMEELREFRLGKWEQMSWGQIHREDPAMYRSFNKRLDLWQVEGAETAAQVRDRMLAGIKRIAAENPGATVAATSHGAALRVLLGTLEGLTLEELGRTGHADNTAVSLLEAEGDEIRVVFRDDNSHVPAALSTFHRQSWHKEDAATDPGLWFQVVREEVRGQRVEGFLEDTPAGTITYAAEGEALRISELLVPEPLRGSRYGVQLLGQAVQYARRLALEDLILTCSRELAGYFAQYGFKEAEQSGDRVTMTMDLRRVIRPIP